MRIRQFITSIFWPDNEPSAVLKPFLWVGRYLYVLMEDLVSGQISLRATSLVYTTLMALVPLIAVSFSMLKAFGVHTNQLEPMMLQFLEPLGAQGRQITQQIVGFIDKVNINVLGVVGILFLIYSSASLIHKMELSFNHVWRVPHQRPWKRRITDYITAILVGPSIMFVAVALSASLLGATVLNNASEYAFVAQGVTAAKKAMPYVMIILAFTFFYLFIPNTRVKFFPALMAGIVAGILWQSAGWMFGTFVVSSKSSATYAIYSGFAILILFMLWIYIGWLILLLGGSLAFYIQHPQHVVPNRVKQDISPKQRKRVGVDAMSLIAHQFESDKRPLSAAALAQRLNVSAAQLNGVLSTLVDAEYICVAHSKGEPVYALLRPADRIIINELLDCIEGEGDVDARNPDDVASSTWVLDKITRVNTEAFSDVTLADVMTLTRTAPHNTQTPKPTEN